MLGIKSTTIRILEFDGDKSSFKFWSAKFLAKSGRSKYKPILTGDKLIPSSSEYDTAVAVEEATRNADQKSIVERYEANILAYDDLLLSMNSTTSSGRVAFSIVDGCKTAANPDRDARQV